MISVCNVVAGGSPGPAMKLDQSFGADDSRLSSKAMSGGSRLIMKRSRSKSETTYVSILMFLTTKPCLALAKYTICIHDIVLTSLKQLAAVQRLLTCLAPP